MPFDNDQAKTELIGLLNSPRQVLLLVGSGSSRFVDYPLWGQLVNELRAAVVPERPFPDGLNLLQKASFVRKTLDEFPNAIDRRRTYRDYLENTFQLRTPSFVPWHQTLVQLPVCGIATTNYDPVLEAAITDLRVKKGLHACLTVDACAADQKHRVFKFFRELNYAGDIGSVLHLHGYWERPNELILTGDDYRTRYGIVDAPVDPAAPLTQPPTILDTFHRKILWALLATRPVLFVGFGVDDPAFRELLGYVQDDFQLAPRGSHIAILPSDPADPDQRERNAAELAGFGVLPLYYDITRDADGTPSYAALAALIEEIASALPGYSGPGGLASLSRNLLAR